MIQVEDFSSLSQDRVDAARQTLAQSLSEYRPQYAVRQMGPLHNLVLHPAAVCAEALAEAGRRLLLSDSFIALDADPTLADDELVSLFFSRWGLERQQGQISSGPVLIVLSAAVPVVISQNAVFTAGTRQYRATQTYQARLEEANILASTDRLLRPLSGGGYGFTIELQAAEEGTAYRLSTGQLLLPSQAIPNFSRAQVVADFSPGRDVETNAQLLARQREGVAAKTLSNRVTMQAAIRQVREDLLSQSIVRFGDPELVRAAHGLLPIATPGRVDWYVKTESMYRQVTTTKVATLVSVDSATGKGIWQLSFTKSEAPGFYDAFRIIPEGRTTIVGTLPVVEDIRGFDLSGDGFKPDIVSAVEAVYTPFQTAVIRFRDELTDIADLSIGATANYEVTTRLVDGLQALQDWASSEDVRYHGGDALLKAGVPCFVAVHFRVEQPSTDEEVDLALVQAQVAAKINGVGFAGKISTSQIADVASDLFSAESTIREVEILGVIRKPSGDEESLYSRDVLEIPAKPSEMTSAKTVCFYCDPEDVEIVVDRV